MNARNRQAIPTTERTRYEVALMRGSQVVHVLGYTARKSKHGIYALCTINLEPFLTKEELTESETFELQYSAKFGFQVASNVYIRFTGNTERAVAA